jgi:hypothetical protein
MEKHEFKAGGFGIADRPCVECGLPDRDDVHRLASSNSETPAPESVRQSDQIAPPPSTVLEQLPVNTVITFRSTIILPEAQENAGIGTVLSGDGPWWMCQIVPPIRICDHCKSTRAEGYFKGSSLHLEVSLAIALTRWWRYHQECAEPLLVGRDTPHGAAQPTEAKTKP